MRIAIFSSLAGGLRRKKQRGAKRMSMIPMIVMSQGNPIAFAMAPPADGPFRDRELDKAVSRRLGDTRVQRLNHFRKHFLLCTEVKGSLKSPCPYLSRIPYRKPRPQWHTRSRRQTHAAGPRGSP